MPATLDSDELSSASAAGDGGSSPNAARAATRSTAPSCVYRGARRSPAAVMSRSAMPSATSGSPRSNAIRPRRSSTRSSCRHRYAYASPISVCAAASMSLAPTTSRSAIRSSHGSSAAYTSSSRYAVSRAPSCATALPHALERPRRCCEVPRHQHSRRLTRSGSAHAGELRRSRARPRRAHRPRVHTWPARIRGRCIRAPACKSWRQRRLRRTNSSRWRPARVRSPPCAP